ncbi:mycothiol transferase [Gordonia sp. (in: high G+C Gram-positive bacteria)]|uniref:mycothiol transferase n=1 Tax=Gordonia sp. (in: high G+C Gram-positive bacteria) TaxID=84139 RepID=UPI003F95EF1D
MYAPARDNEITGFVGYLDQQLDHLRAALYGLTEEQARLTPCRSVLSVGGVLKHIAHSLPAAAARLRGESVDRVFDEAGFAEYMGSFALTDDETAAGLIERFDADRAAFIAAARGCDPDGDSMELPAPWAGILDSRPIKNRYYLGHLLEEFARHAGHADIIREQIDGQSVPGLVLSLSGAPANDFFTPYRAESGTLLA